MVRVDIELIRFGQRTYTHAGNPVARRWRRFIYWNEFFIRIIRVPVFNVFLGKKKMENARFWANTHEVRVLIERQKATRTSVILRTKLQYSPRHAGATVGIVPVKFATNRAETATNRILGFINGNFGPIANYRIFYRQCDIESVMYITSLRG